MGREVGRRGQRAIMGDYFGTNIDELIRLRISRLKSVEIARKLIKEKYIKSGIEFDEKLLSEKAKGLSSTIESALNYLSITEKGLNAKILSRYYAFLQYISITI
jgi:hypothetical protein